jgi:hypothetical protein
MTEIKARTLAYLLPVAGRALSRQLNLILSSLVQTLGDDNGRDPLRQTIDETIRISLASITDFDGLDRLMVQLLEW